MALSKFSFIVDNDNSTTTVVDTYTGMLYKILIFNNNAQSNTFRLYLQDSVILYEQTLNSKETIELKPEIYLQAETLKIYSQLKDLHVVIEFLTN